MNKATTIHESRIKNIPFMLFKILDTDELLTFTELWKRSHFTTTTQARIIRDMPQGVEFPYYGDEVAIKIY